MASFNFYLKEKWAEKETPIHLYVRYSGQRLIYSTGKLIHPKFWSEAKQQAREVKEFPQYKPFNNTLKNLRETAEKELLQLESELVRIPTTKELKNRLDEVFSPSSQITSPSIENQPVTFLELFETFIEESESGIRLTTSGKKFDKRSIQKYRTVYENLKEFGKTHYLAFETIDKNFYSKYAPNFTTKY